MKTLSIILTYNQSDRMKFIYEALMLVTQRKGKTVTRKEIVANFSLEKEILRVKKVLFRLMYECEIPKELVAAEFDMSSTYITTQRNQPPDIIELELFDKCLNEIDAIFNRNELKLM